MTAFAWTPGQNDFDRGHNYVHYPQYFNVGRVRDGAQSGGLRVVVRGPETFDGQHYAMGETVAIVLPPDVARDFAAALAKASGTETRQVGNEVPSRSDDSPVGAAETPMTSKGERGCGWNGYTCIYSRYSAKPAEAPLDAEPALGWREAMLDAARIAHQIRMVVGCTKELADMAEQEIRQAALSAQPPTPSKGDVERVALAIGTAMWGKAQADTFMQLPQNAHFRLMHDAARAALEAMQGEAK